MSPSAAIATYSPTPRSDDDGSPLYKPRPPVAASPLAVPRPTRTSMPPCEDNEATVKIVPRPFPPPALQGIPIQYIVDQLHHLAPYYWHKPETTDCTILVPTDQVRPAMSRSSRHADIPLGPGMFSAGLDVRRGSAPTAGARTRMTLKLHQDYLVAQSSLFRALFSGSSHLDLNSGTPTSPTASPGRTTRTPRLLPSSPTHPILFLPLPDPTSFPHLVHYLYFGSTTFMEECLARGSIKWDGVVRNVEYLGLRNEIKQFLGRWYGNWMTHGNADGPIVYEESSDEEDTESDADDDDFSSGSRSGSDDDPTSESSA